MFLALDRWREAYGRIDVDGLCENTLNKWEPSSHSQKSNIRTAGRKYIRPLFPKKMLSYHCSLKDLILDLNCTKTHYFSVDQPKWSQEFIDSLRVKFSDNFNDFLDFPLNCRFFEDVKELQGPHAGWSTLYYLNTLSTVIIQIVGKGLKNPTADYHVFMRKVLRFNHWK
jgi:hypothetical protein